VARMDGAAGEASHVEELAKRAGAVRPLPMGSAAIVARSLGVTTR
jgi:hypothetical protein